MNKYIILMLVFISINDATAKSSRRRYPYGFRDITTIEPETTTSITSTTTTPLPQLKHIDFFKNLAHFDDADVRGPNWYNYGQDSKFGSSDGEEHLRDETLSSSNEGNKSKRSSDYSDIETSEDKRKTQRYRICHPCPEDMMKSYTNLGIKWICAGYHRARRTFKSSCMMRFRNCQDGTLYVKMYDRRCTDEKYHGKHFFYIYPV